MMSANYSYDKKRFETFIDAVIAIILTILVLELRVPESEDSHRLTTMQQVASLLPSFTSYIGSFLLIAGVWIDHHVLFLNLVRLTKRYILLNMLFILFLSMVPFTTAFAGVHHRDPFAVALLFLNYFFMNLLYANLYWHGYRKQLLIPEFWKESKVTGKLSMIGIIGLLAAVPLAYVNTYVSFAMGILIFTGQLMKKR